MFITFLSHTEISWFGWIQI